MSDILLEACDVHCRFPAPGLPGRRRTIHAVNGVSLRLRRGEILGLVGESGCGKSTLARMLLGLQPPSAGDILLGDGPIGRLDRKAVARRIQPIFQDPYASLNARKSVEEIVGLPLSVHGVPGDRRAAVAEMLARVGLASSTMAARPDQLSGGQRQRVAIARALILRPEIVICDEPTSALDVSVQAQILNLLLELQRDLGTSYLLISHNLAVVEHLASRVAVMYLGRLVEVAEAGTLFRAPRHPYTQALLAAVPRLEPGRRFAPIDLGTAFPNPLDPPSGCGFHPRCRHATEVCRTTPPPAVRTETGHVACHLAA